MKRAWTLMRSAGCNRRYAGWTSSPATHGGYAGRRAEAAVLDAVRWHAVAVASGRMTPRQVLNRWGDEGIQVEPGLWAYRTRRAAWRAVLCDCGD